MVLVVFSIDLVVFREKYHDAKRALVCYLFNEDLKFVILRVLPLLKCLQEVVNLVFRLLNIAVFVIEVLGVREDCQEDHYVFVD